MDALTQSAAAATAAATKGSKTAGSEDAKTGAGGVIGSDFETFLKMLTAQIQNQDPLNPMDSSDYAVQLATFSSVEQQVLTNELLKTMGGGAGGLASYAGWVGMEARQDGPLVFDGDPVTLGLNVPDDAVKTELIVATTDGTVLDRVDVTGAGAELVWTGKSAGGSPLLTGNYMVETASTRADGSVSRSPVSSYAPVTEVRSGPDGVEIVFANGAAVPPDTVTALRQSGT